jgi:hypothetical protein
MNRLQHRPSRTPLVVAFAAVCALLLVSFAAAQAPPQPPSRFVGTVAVNGTPAASGTVVEARIGGTSCGTGTVFIEAGQSRYVVDVAAAASTAGCGADGSQVSFFVGGAQANETGSWANFQLNSVNLTVGGAAPAATATRPASTPAPPATGDGGVSGSNAAPSLIVLGLIAAALGLSGAGLAVRSRKV